MTPKQYKIFVCANEISERYFDDYDIALRFAKGCIESGNAYATYIVDVQENKIVYEYRLKDKE